jgi:hypothetical protein
VAGGYDVRAADAAAEPRELLCMVCHREHAIWSASNELWNAVLRRPDGSDEYPFICASCFMLLAVERGVTTMFNVTDYRRAAHECANCGRRCANCDETVPEPRCNEPSALRTFGPCVKPAGHTGFHRHQHDETGRMAEPPAAYGPIPDRKHLSEIAWALRNPQAPFHEAKRLRLARILERFADVARLRPPEKQWHAAEPPAARPARSWSEYKRLTAQGVDVQPPAAATTEPIAGANMSAKLPTPSPTDQVKPPPPPSSPPSGYGRQLGTTDTGMTVVRTDVGRCAHCNYDHPQLAFRKLRNPIGVWTHWAPCPTRGEPILLTITATQDGEVAKPREAEQPE